MRFAYAHINWFDYELYMGTLEAENHYEALKQCYILAFGDGEADYSNLPPTIEGLKAEAFDCDGMISVLELKD